MTSKPSVIRDADEALSEDMNEASEPSKLDSHSVHDDLNDINKLIQETQQEDPKQLVESLQESIPTPKVIMRQEMIDDYIRNFFLKYGLEKSLGTFQREWYEISQKGKIRSNDDEKTPDIKIKNQQMEEKLDKLKSELHSAKISAEAAKATWDKLKKEKEYHMQHHKRVQEEKEKLFKDIEKLKKLHLEYEDRYEQLKKKYEAATKEKMLIKMERDRFQKSTNELTQTMKRLEKQDLSEEEDEPPKQKANEKTAATDSKKNTTGKPAAAANLTKIPKQEPENPFATTAFEAFPTKNINPTRNLRAHNLSVTCLAVHPRKPFVATGGDDYAWKIWSVPGGEMIIQGESHKDWISGLDFNPTGTNLVTCSGDSTIKIWDFVKVQCAATFKCHTQPVLSVSYHYTGDFLVSGSMDQSCRLLDIPTQKSRHIFRGHVDSVSTVKFLPYSNVFVSSSADKTISLWDIRTGLCVQTLYGHINCINSVDVNCRGDSLVSGDVDGVVKVWDIKKVAERNQFDSGIYSANSVAWDKSCQTIGVACDDGQIKLFSDDGKTGGKLETKIKAHTGAVNGIGFESNTKTMITVGVDGEYKFWN